MKFEPIDRVKVSLDIEGEVRLIGELGWSSDERLAYFQYAASYLETPLTLSPFHLPPKLDAQPARREPFEGLHGLFNDSLPDGWGRLLLDRRLRAQGIDHARLTPLDRLACVGRNGMGALCFEPDRDKPKYPHSDVGLDWFADEVAKLQAEFDVKEIDMLQAAQGGSAGARPKIMIGFSSDRDRIVIDYGQPLPDTYERWLVKFKSINDPPDMGAEEQAYALMAKAAGVDMSETRLIETDKGNRLFATRRFDRTPAGRLHLHTLSGLVYADHRFPALDYTDILKVVSLMTRDQSEVLRMFRRMVFNILAHNRDDHAKNHALLMTRDGKWSLSPAYDLTYSEGPGGEHSTSVAGEGRAPTLSDMLEIARRASISERDAKAVIERVRAAIDDWPHFASEGGVSKTRTAQLRSHMNKS